MGFSYNVILNYVDNNDDVKKKDLSCLDCISFTPIGGGESGTISRCLSKQTLWTAKDCVKFVQKD